MLKHDKIVFLSITALGISSIVTQIIIMREFMSIFPGNELVIGIIFSLWLLLTGLGTYLGRHSGKIKHKVLFLALSQAAVSILPFIMAIFVRHIPGYFVPGEELGLSYIILFSLFTLLPYCLLSGFFLPMACVILSRRKSSRSIGRVYLLDNIGDIAGGFLFTFILAFLFNHLWSVYLIFLINIAASCLILFYSKRMALGIAAALIGLLVTALMAAYDLDLMTTQKLYPKQDIIFKETSQYGKLVAARSGSQINIFQDRSLIASTGDIVSREEKVHFAMLQLLNLKNPAESGYKVLLLSGGISGTLDELLKYKIDKVDYVELDPKIIEIGYKFGLIPDDQRINIHKIDARRFISMADEVYDLILVDLPLPENSDTNKFYTEEFFSEAKEVLKTGGILTFPLGGYYNYFSEADRMMHSSVYNSLDSSFENIMMVPSSSIIYIATDGNLTYNFSGLIEDIGIKNDYINSGYLKGMITEERIYHLNNIIDKSEKKNKDLEPVAYHHQVKRWIGQFGGISNTIIFIIMLALVFYAFKLSRIQYSIFSTGFSAMGIELIIVFLIEVFYGFIYHEIGVLITIFMVGVAIGAYIANQKIRRSARKTYLKSEAFLLTIILATALGIFLKTSAIVDTDLGFRLFLWLMLFLAAVVTGIQFPLASRLSFRDVETTSSRLYHADLIGSAIGSFVIIVLAIPLIGIYGSMILLFVIKVLSLLRIAKA